MRAAGLNRPKCSWLKVARSENRGSNCAILNYANAAKSADSRLFRLAVSMYDAPARGNPFPATRDELNGTRVCE